MTNPMREALERIRLIAETDGIPQLVEICDVALSPVQDMENHVVSGQPNESAVPQQETDRQIASLRQQLQDCEIGLSTWDDGKNSEYWLRYPARAGEAVEEINSHLPREEQRGSPEWLPDPKTVEQVAEALAYHDGLNYRGLGESPHTSNGRPYWRSLAEAAIRSLNSQTSAEKE